MSHTARGSLAATVLVVGVVGLLGGCTAQPSEQPVSPVPGQAQPLDPIPSAAAPGRAPLGLEVRYVDQNGRFATLSPENFPR
jgi:hypothetical protein